MRLEISEDEMRDLLTKIWHMSGYDIDKKDPVVIEYMMHKIILRQYEEHLLEQTRYFLDKFLPYTGVILKFGKISMHSSLFPRCRPRRVENCG